MTTKNDICSTVLDHRKITDAREARLRRSLKRLGFELVDADGGQFYISHEGTRVHATSDLFGLSLDGVEQWIREQVRRVP